MLARSRRNRNPLGTGDAPRLIESVLFGVKPGDPVALARTYPHERHPEQTPWPRSAMSEAWGPMCYHG